MRALLLVSILVLLIAGAYLWQSSHQVGAATRPAPGVARNDSGDVVFEIGGGAPAPRGPGAPGRQSQ